MKIIFANETVYSSPISFFFLFFTFLCYFHNTSFAQWTKQNSGINTNLTDIFFVDSLYGWAIGDSGIIIATTDGGENWNNIYTLSDTVGLKQIQFIDRKIGFVGGNVIKKYPTYVSRQVILLRTKDGGFNWVRCDSSFDSSFSFGNMSFLNSDTGYISLNNEGQLSWNNRRGILFKTTNGGSSWSVIDEKKLLLNGAFVFVNDKGAYSFWAPFLDNSDNTEVYVTSDGGGTWNLVSTINVELVKKAKFMAADILWAIGFKTSLSLNAGKDWKSWNWFSPVIEGEKRYIPRDIELLDPSNICLIGDAMSSPNDIEGRLLITNNSGEDWRLDLQLPNYSFSALSIVNGRESWIVGSNGLIMHNNDILTGVNSKEVELPKNFNLSQNYPNPFNPTTTIRYSIPSVGRSAYDGSTSKVVLKVYDMLGREITTLVNEEKAPGNYEVKFSVETLHATSLPSGIYFYRLQAGSFSQTKKLVLIK